MAIIKDVVPSNSGTLSKDYPVPAKADGMRITLFKPQIGNRTSTKGTRSLIGSYCGSGKTLTIPFYIRTYGIAIRRR